jgi:hypothetical protein
VDSNFGFLSSTQVQLLDEILARRNPTLSDRIRHCQSVARSDADDVVTTLSEELTDNLDNEWELTEYGRTVSGILAQFNAARIRAWPE